MRDIEKTKEELAVELQAAQKLISELWNIESDRQLAEEALKESEQFLRSTLDCLSANIALLDNQGKILHVNKAWNDFAQQNGLYPNDVSIGTNYLDICDAASGTYAKEAVQFAKGIRSVAGGETDFFILEYPCDSPTKRRWFAGRVTPFPGESPRKVVVAHEDITERKQAEEEMRESEIRFRRITDSALDSILMIDPSGRVSVWNPSAERLLGYSRDEAVGQDLHFLIAPERYLDSYTKAFKKFQSTGQGDAIGKTIEIFARKKDGREIPISLSLSSLHTADGWHAVGIIRDNSELQRLEKVKDDLERISRHNLKSPLTGIINIPELLMDDENLTVQQKNMLNLVIVSGRKMLLQINSSLDLYKIESGTYKFLPQNCDLLEIIKGVSELLGKGMEFNPNKVHIHENYTQNNATGLSILSDDGLLEIILINLIKNAVEASGHDDPIDVSISYNSVNCNISISNSRPVPTEIRDKFFEKYTTAGKSGGTGLGTYSAAIMTRAIGGTISMTTSDEIGTKVTVCIPKVPRS
ncbi:PAS domain S-box protein [Solidesulfovibrio sp.]